MRVLYLNAVSKQVSRWEKDRAQIFFVILVTTHIEGFEVYQELAFLPLGVEILKYRW